MSYKKYLTAVLRFKMNIFSISNLSNVLKTLLGLSKLDIYLSGRGFEVSEDIRFEFKLKANFHPVS